MQLPVTTFPLPTRRFHSECTFHLPEYDRMLFVTTLPLDAVFLPPPMKIAETFPSTIVRVMRVRCESGASTIPSPAMCETKLSRICVPCACATTIPDEPTRLDDAFVHVCTW